MKNKNVLIMLALVASLSLGACGSNTASVDATESVVATEEATESLNEEMTETTEVLLPEDTETADTELPTEETTSEVTEESQPWDENRTADTMDELEQNYQDAMNSWTKKATWTASNGVVIKINDAWADIVTSGKLEGGGNAAAIYYDGTEDLTPNSDFMNACNEFIYGDEAYLNGTDRWNSEVVDVSKLPDIPCASSKQTSIPNSSDFTNYKTAFDEMYGFQVSGVWGANPAYCLQNYGSGIGLVAGGSGYLWTLDYNGSEFVVTIKSNLSELQWDALHNSLRLVSPDGDSLYNEFYTQFYSDNPTFPEYDMWVTIGNSQAMVHAGDYAYCYFK